MPWKAKGHLQEYTRLWWHIKYTWLSIICILILYNHLFVHMKCCWKCLIWKSEVTKRCTTGLLFELPLSWCLLTIDGIHGTFPNVLFFRLPGKRDGDLCRNSKTTVAPRSFTLSTKSFSDSEYIFELQDSTKIQASQRCLSISSISVFIPTWCKHETHDRIRSSLKGSMLSGGGKSGSRDIWPVLGVSPYNPQEIGRLNFPNWGWWWLMEILVGGFPPPIWKICSSQHPFGPQTSKKNLRRLSKLPSGGVLSQKLLELYLVRLKLGNETATELLSFHLKYWYTKSCISSKGRYLIDSKLFEQSQVVFTGFSPSVHVWKQYSSHTENNHTMSQFFYLSDSAMVFNSLILYKETLPRAWREVHRSPIPCVLHPVCIIIPRGFPSFVTSSFRRWFLRVDAVYSVYSSNKHGK